ncbi:MAG TPA: kynureninase [Bacteroidia bacterium]|jgi:kynureninase|nr:kynureninase [Bacteroidia bacterium]
MNYQNTIEFARQLDADDVLKKYRARFYFPQMNGQDVIYFTGNSLGLQPKATQDYVLDELEDWANFGVEGHFHARKPWLSYHEQFAEPLAQITGAKPEEIVVMNQLTVNLHLLLVSFYRPTSQRFKILCEAKAFPSDQYALESQIKFHGFDPAVALVEVEPRKGETCIRQEDILAAIETNRNELALVMIGGVNYYTGQVFDMPSITSAAQKAGAFVGFDLAHAAGNLKLNLHDWNVDFACWCSYKYLNSGPGGVAGVFVHERHLQEKDLPRFAGWWGHDKASRFKMEKGFVPMPTAEAWQMSNAPVLSMAAHKAALDIFSQVGMDALVQKSEKLTGYLEFIIDALDAKLEIITPRDKKQRGCQLSIVAHGRGKELFQKLMDGGAITDWREPNVIRCAPVPLYNSFEDIHRFGTLLKASL